MNISSIWPDFRQEWIVYRDGDVIAVYKPAGVNSQSADTVYCDDIVSRIRRYLAAERGQAPEDVYLGVHQRLDKETSGVMLYTLRPSANRSIAQQFEGGNVAKTYLAAVENTGRRPLDQVLRHYLTPRRSGVVRVCKRTDRGAKQAVTALKTLRTKAHRALLQVRPSTGRTHQIRVQLAAAGAPVAGDRQYGGPPAPRLMLHAESLCFRRPADHRPMAVQYRPPPEFARWIAHGSQHAYDDLGLVRARIASAVEARWGLGRAAEVRPPTSAFRLINGASDGLPGLAVDLYHRWLVVHVYSGPIEAVVEPILDLLDEIGFEGIYLKRHPKQANELGDARDSYLAPAEPSRGAAAPSELQVYEYGLPLIVRLSDGLRTGLFLDQRENRRRVRESSRGLRVLNLFAYTGGFSAAAVAGGADIIVSVDDSNAALSWCERNVALSRPGANHRAKAADVFDAMASFERSREQFDLVVVDPPSYSTTHTRRFRVIDDLVELVAAAMRITSVRGRLLISVNHRAITENALRRGIFTAARSIGRTIVNIKDLPPQSDFPFQQDEAFGSKSALAVLA